MTIARSSTRKIGSNAGLLSTLVVLGAIDKKQHYNHVVKRTQRGIKRGHIGRYPQNELWDLYDKAKENWKRLMKKHHPDNGGDHGRAAYFNCAWLRAKLLFSRVGIP